MQSAVSIEQYRQRSAVTIEHDRQRSGVSKQIIGLTAAFLTGAAITPMNMYALPEMPKTGTNGGVQTEIQYASVQSITNLKIMEISSTAVSQADLNVNNMAAIDVERHLPELKAKVISSVLTWQGISYKWGGRTKAGVDCSGLVQRVFAEAGIYLPRTSYEQFREGVGVPKAKLESGDLVFFSTSGAGASHVGIYLGDGQFISATRHCVEIQSLDAPYWAKSYRGSRRVLA